MVVAFHTVPLVPERLISGSLSFYLDWFFDFHEQGENYDASGITAADREAYVQAYSAPGSLGAALGWFRAFGQDIVDNEVWLRSPVDVPYLAIAEPHVIGPMTAQSVADRQRSQDRRDWSLRPLGDSAATGQVANALLAFLGDGA